MMLLHSVKERAIKVKGHPKEPGKLAHSNRGSCCRVSLDLLDLNSKALSQGPRRCLLDGASFCFSLSCACCINSSSSLDWLSLALASSSCLHL